METIKGIDVSYYQGLNINWTSVSSTGVQFAYIKASEGQGRKEPNALVQSSGAKKAGLKIGYYHFSHIDADSPVDEAIFFDNVLKGLPEADLIPVLDIETNKSGLSPIQVTRWMEGFVQKMNQLGYPEVMIYSYTPFLNQYLVPPSTILAPTKLWIAQYTSAPAPSIPKGYSKYDVWQYSNSGKINGIQGNVDVNVCYELPLKSISAIKGV